MRSDFATVPSADTPVPPAMADIAGDTLTLVWLNEAGGLTGRVDGVDPRYIKWNPEGSGESLAAEADRLRWLEGRHPAPVVIELVNVDGAELLVTRALPGLSAVDDVWVGDPDSAIRAIARGMRMLHELPVDECVFDWGVAARITEAAEYGISVPAPLRDSPEIDRLVVCHGDACAPNTLLDDDGRFLANVDFGRLGIADRWADLAVATMSLGWNYENYDETLFWDTYGVRPDVERIDYYRALWNAT
jgi:kanamycin kinase